MSKKDYTRFAELLKNQRAMFQDGSFTLSDGFNRQAGIQYINHLAEQIANIFAEDNPNFSRSRFLVACGIQED